MAEDPLDIYRHGYEKAARFYDLFADNRDIPFYLTYAKAQGSPILELAAGTGRVSIALAKAGFEVVMLESSEAMLAEFKRKSTSLPLTVRNRIQVYKGDMRNFSFDNEFPMIIIPTSFGHALTTEEQLSLLGCVRKHLSDSGIFIVDLFLGETQHSTASFEDVPVPIDDERTVSRVGTLSIDPTFQILRMDLTYVVRSIRTGEILEEIHQPSGAALVYYREANLLLKMAGMKIVEEYGDFDRSPFDFQSGRRVLIVRKS